MRKEFENQPFRAGKSFKQFTDFITQCNTGKRILYTGINFVAMDKKSYKSETKKRQEAEKRIDDIVDDIKNYCNEICPKDENNIVNKKSICERIDCFIFQLKSTLKQKEVK